MTISRSLISAIAASSIAFGAVTTVQSASAQTTPREWTFVDISDSETSIGASYDGSFTFTNPSEDEIVCTAYAADVKYLGPAFDVWITSKEGWSPTYKKAYEYKYQISRDETRTGESLHTVGVRSYIAPLETVEFPLSRVSPGWGVLVECSSQDSSNNITHLAGYGIVQPDYSIKSSIPVSDNALLTPPATPIPIATVTKLVTPPPVTTTVAAEPLTVTQAVPTTVHSTATRVSTVTSTADAPTVTVSVNPVTVTEVVSTTVRATETMTEVHTSMVSVPTTVRSTETRTATITSTTGAPTVTVTAKSEPLTVTQAVPTTVHSTATRVSTVTSTADAPTVTVSVNPVTVTEVVPTTVRATETMTEVHTSMVSVPTTVRSTETRAATVTKTVVAEPAKSGSSDTSVIGWIVGILIALGLGGIAGFMAQNLGLPGMTF